MYEKIWYIYVYQCYIPELSTTVKVVTVTSQMWELLRNVDVDLVSNNINILLLFIYIYQKGGLKQILWDPVIHQ